LAWDDPGRLAHQLDEAAEAFGLEVARRQAAWLVLWCAGAGGVGTPPEELARETEALRHLLGRLSALQARRAARRPGLLLLSSSAGGVYGASGDLPLSEDSPCLAISEYGRNKLRQEEAVAAWGGRTPDVSVLVARISNLYGFGPNPARGQGLITRLAQCLIHRRPLNIYVPLDTLRDYLHVRDAARHLLRCVHRLLELDRPVCVTKIVAAEHSVSVARIIGILARVAKRPPRIVCVPQAAGRQQPARLRFRSRIWTDLAPPPTDLAAGILDVYQHALTLLKAARLPSPPVT
jgi:UDP-glucose 4-epimerase